MFCRYTYLQGVLIYYRRQDYKRKGIMRKKWCLEIEIDLDKYPYEYIRVALSVACVITGNFPLFVY